MFKAVSGSDYRVVDSCRDSAERHHRIHVGPRPIRARIFQDEGSRSEGPTSTKKNVNKHGVRSGVSDAGCVVSKA